MTYRIVNHPLHGYEYAQSGHGDGCEWHKLIATQRGGSKRKARRSSWKVSVMKEPREEEVKLRRSFCG